MKRHFLFPLIGFAVMGVFFTALMLFFTITSITSIIDTPSERARLCDVVDHQKSMSAAEMTELTKEYLPGNISWDTPTWCASPPDALDKIKREKICMDNYDMAKLTIQKHNNKFCRASENATGCTTALIIIDYEEYRQNFCR